MDNDRSPYVWKTDDYGATWTRIVDGIRDDAYVNAVREDPTREGMLYAGTQHGVYVSYDDGANWQELEGFRDIPNRRFWFSPAESPWQRGSSSPIPVCY